MSKIINIENYESFYLDYLEGNLNENDTQLLLTFLDKNPHLKVDEDLLSVSPDVSNQLDEFSKSLLKFQHIDHKINESNIEFYLIASIENQLSEEKTKELTLFLQNNPSFLIDFHAYQQTRLIPDLNISYPEKQKIKRGMIIPLYAKFLAVAAGLALLFSVFNLNQLNHPKGYAQQAHSQKKIIKNKKQNSKSENIQINESTDYSMQVARMNVEKNTTESGFLVNNESVQPLQFKAIDAVDNSVFETADLIAYNPSIPVYQSNSDFSENALAAVEMKNPIKPITNRIGEAINQQVEFKTSKAAKKKPGGFFLKIGKFEVSRNVYEGDALAAK